MFDARTDLAHDIIQDGCGLTLKESAEIACIEFKKALTLGTPENIARERKQIDELAAYIEDHYLDDLTSMGCVDSFRFLAVAYLDRDFKGIECYRNSVRKAAAHQIWYKYNH
ncbi:hypothetical protein K5D67_23180 [Pseudomonas cichorii]|nr:hypothetical protein [Pseudomonas cichorii]